MLNPKSPYAPKALFALCLILLMGGAALMLMPKLVFPSAVQGAVPGPAVNQSVLWWSSSVKLYKHPHAIWLTGDQVVGSNLGALDRNLMLAKNQRRVPELVLYFIPQRDLGQSSSGGFSTYTDYFAENELLAARIKKFVKETGLKPRIYLEPDALGHAISYRWDRNYDAKSQRIYQLRTLAFKRLVKTYQEAGALVYLDVAHSDWIQTDEQIREMAQALIDSGVQNANGLVSNISNRQPIQGEKAQTEASYFQKLLPLVPNSKLDLVIDSSRNGGLTSARQYALLKNGQLVDNQAPKGRLVGSWRTESKTGETWLHPFFGLPKAMSLLLKDEKYRFDETKQLLMAPPWLDPIGDVKLGPAPSDQARLEPGQVARLRYVKPPDECDGSLNCPPGKSKSTIIRQTKSLQPARGIQSRLPWQS